MDREKIESLLNLFRSLPPVILLKAPDPVPPLPGRLGVGVQIVDYSPRLIYPLSKDKEK